MTLQSVSPWLSTCVTAGRVVNAFMTAAGSFDVQSTSMSPTVSFRRRTDPHTSRRMTPGTWRRTSTTPLAKSLAWSMRIREPAAARNFNPSRILS